MGEVVNLRRARKAKRREVATAQADANRVASGVGKIAREVVKTEAKRAAQVLDGAKLND